MERKIKLVLDGQLLEKLDEKLIEYNMDINEYFAWLIRCDIERDSDKAPNFVGYLSPENVRLVDDCFRAERCNKAMENVMTNANYVNVHDDFQKDIENNLNKIRDTKAKIGESVINELRKRIF